VCCRWFGQVHFAGLGIKAPDIVGLFVGEPQNSIVVEYGRVRVDFRSLRWAIFGDFAALGIELADVTAGDRGEPDVAFFVGHQAVRPGSPSLQGIFLELSGLQIKPAQLIRSLARVPERAVGCQRRVVRS
jgi:hypothetical protein